jgi:Leucine-rich repeat (LRR) protein
MEVLKVAGNQISALPKSLDALHQIRTLDVGGNTLTQFTLPKTITSLNIAENPWFHPNDDDKSIFSQFAEKEHARLITVLDASNTRLPEIWESICKLRVLTVKLMKRA